MISLLYGLVTFHAVLQIGAIMAGLCRVDIRGVDACLLLATAAILACGVAIQCARRDADGVYGRALETPGWRRAGMAIVVVGGMVFLALGIAAYIMHDETLDGRGYHLPIIHQWLTTGGIGWADDRFVWSRFMNGNPKAVETFVYVLVGATGDAHWGNAGNLFFLPLGVVGIAVLASLMGAGRWLAWAVGSLFILVPNNMAQATQSYVDTAHATCSIAAFAVLGVIVSDRLKNRSLGLLDALIVGGACGLAAGTKGQGLAVAGIVTGAVVLNQAFACKEEKHNSKWIKTVIFAVSIAGMCFLVSGYWYVSNWYHTGNPLYPVGLKVAGVEIFRGLNMSDSAEAGLPGGVKGLPRVVQIAYAWSQLDGWPVNLKMVDPRSAGLGFLWVVGCFPAVCLVFRLIWKRRQSLDQASIICLWLLAAVIPVFLITPANWWSRYVLSLYAVGLPCLALVVPRVWSNYFGRLWVILVMTLTVLECALCLYWFVRPCMVRSVAREPLALVSPAAWRESWDFYSPETARAAVWPGLGVDEPVAVNEDRAVMVVGDLGMNLGHGPIYALGKSPTKPDIQALLNKGVHKVIWCGGDPIPVSLTDLSRHQIKKPDGMDLFELE